MAPRLTTPLLARLDRLGRAQHLLVALATLVALWAADYLTGWQISFSVFYLLPVAQCAWYVGRRSALGMSVICAASWLVINTVAGQEYASVAIAAWNALVRAGFYIVVAETLDRLKRTLWELHAALARAEALSRNDALTGILNGQSFVEAVDAECRRALRYRHPLVVAYLDADGFKAINDSAGHESGNQALQLIARTLTQTLRSTDVVARLGGDEFGVLLPETGATEARPLLDKLRLALQEALARHGWEVSFSVGAVLVDPVTGGARPVNAEQLMRLADGLMYGVKRSGKNAVALHPVPAAAGILTPRDTPRAMQLR